MIWNMSEWNEILRILYDVSKVDLEGRTIIYGGQQGTYHFVKNEDGSYEFLVVEEGGESKNTMEMENFQEFSLFQDFITFLEENKDQL